MTKKMKFICDFLRKRKNHAWILKSSYKRYNKFSLVDRKVKMVYNQMWHQTFYALLNKGLIEIDPEETKKCFSYITAYKLKEYNND